jgi:hypothetical protein
VQFGHLSHESVMRTIELLGTKIIPELNKREVQTEVQAVTKVPRDASEAEGLRGLVD